jgi:hypothetical protein
MPADDLTINVRQIAGYGAVAQASQTMALLVQVAGLGSAYASISPQDLVGTALATGGDMSVGGVLSAQAFMGGSGQFTNVAASILNAQTACILDLNATHGTIGGIPIASIADVAATVTSFNFRTGAVMLELGDIICAGGAPIASPYFWGNPRAPTPAPDNNSDSIATTMWVQSALATLTLAYAPLDSPNFTGVPTAPTAAVGSSDGQLATTAFVMNAVAESTAGVASFNTRTGAVVLTTADITGAGGAPLASPTFTGVPAAATAALGTNTTQLATTAFVAAAVASGTSGVASFNSRTGAVTLTTTDITGAGGALTASTVATFNGRSGAVNLIANDISGASGALLASPAFTGTPSAPTPTAGDNSTRLATTAFVASQSGFAPLASPAFTGVPTAPTASVGTNSTQLATTAYVEAAVAASTAGVSSFNSRTGAVTLQANDISAAGGALLASPALTGTPSAPTAAVATSTTQLATCAFVMAALAAGAVTSFNTRIGAVTLTAADLTAAGGALSAGVTNGSDAAVGQVGQFVTTTSAAVPVSWGSLQQFAALSLSAGDWDVWGDIQFIPTGIIAAMTSLAFGLSLSATAFGVRFIALATPNYPTSAGYYAIAPRLRVSVAATTSVYFLCQFTGGSGGTPTCDVQMNARRVR